LVIALKERESRIHRFGAPVAPRDLAREARKRGEHSLVAVVREICGEALSGYAANARKVRLTEWIAEQELGKAPRE